MLNSSGSNLSQTQTEHRVVYKKKEKARERYSRQELVGKGAYGAVYKGIDNVTSQVVAIKVLNLDTEEDDVGDIRKEINLLSQLKHSDSYNITKYLGSFLNGTKLWIIMEYAAGGSIRELMKARRIEEKFISIITKEVLQALSYLHKCKIIHRDIKAANILLTGEGKVQLCDFGVAGQLTATSSKRTSFVGTPYWMAPEVIVEGALYDTKADIWSLGITVYEIATGNPPFAEQSAMKAIALIPKSPPARLEGPFSPSVKEFVEICLNEIPDERPNADELIKTKFIKNAAKSQPGILRELIVRYDHWRQTTGHRHSFSDPFGTPSSESDSFDPEEESKADDDDAWVFDTVRSTTHRKSRSLSSVQGSFDPLSPVKETDESLANLEGKTQFTNAKFDGEDENDRTVIPKERRSLEQAKLNGLLSPTTPMFHRKFSESQHPLLQLFDREPIIENALAEQSSTNGFFTPTISIPPMGINSTEESSKTARSKENDSSYNKYSLTLEIKDFAVAKNKSPTPRKQNFHINEMPRPEIKFPSADESLPSTPSASYNNHAGTPTQNFSNGLLSPTDLSSPRALLNSGRSDNSYFSGFRSNSMTEASISNMNQPLLSPPISPNSQRSMHVNDRKSSHSISPPPESSANSHQYPSSPVRSVISRPVPTRHMSFDTPNDSSLAATSGGLHRTPSSSNRHHSPNLPKRVRSATTLNDSSRPNEDLFHMRSKHQQTDSNGSSAGEGVTKINGSLGIHGTRQRSISVSNMLTRSPKFKALTTDDEPSNLLLPPSPTDSKFGINAALLNSANSPTRKAPTPTGGPIVNNGPDIKPLKMDNYRGTSEVYEDLAKAAEDLNRWLEHLDAGLVRLLKNF